MNRGGWIVFVFLLSIHCFFLASGSTATILQKLRINFLGEREGKGAEEGGMRYLESGARDLKSKYKKYNILRRKEGVIEVGVVACYLGCVERWEEP